MMDHASDTGVVKRLETLEKELRRWKMIGGVFVLAVCALVVIGATKAERFDDITVKHISVVDNEDKLIMEIGKSYILKEGHGIYILDADRHQLAATLLWANGAPFLQLMGEGKPGVVLNTTSRNGSFLMFKDTAGNVLSVIGAAEGNGVMDIVTKPTGTGIRVFSSDMNKTYWESPLR
ncbi:MAG: hypothetical protein ABII64_08145 [Elusimicrobiota bacterium]